MNIAILIGRLTRDPELKYLANTGTPVATFSLAVDKQYGFVEVDSENENIPF